MLALVLLTPIVLMMFTIQTVQTILSLLSNASLRVPRMKDGMTRYSLTSCHVSRIQPGLTQSECFRFLMCTAILTAQILNIA